MAEKHWTFSSRATAFVGVPQHQTVRHLWLLLRHRTSHLRGPELTCALIMLSSSMRWMDNLANRHI